MRYNIVSAIRTGSALAYAGIFATAWWRGYQGYNLGSALVLVLPVACRLTVINRPNHRLYKGMHSFSCHLLINPLMTNGFASVGGLSEDNFVKNLSVAWTLLNVMRLYRKVDGDVLGTFYYDNVRILLTDLFYAISYASIRAYAPYLNKWAWSSNILNHVIHNTLSCGASMFYHILQGTKPNWKQENLRLLQNTIIAILSESLGVLLDKYVSLYHAPILHSLGRSICISVAFAFTHCIMPQRKEYGSGRD